MTDSLILGIDPAKEKFTAAFLTASAPAGEPGRDLPMTRAGLEALGQTIAGRLVHGQRLVVGVEATAALDDNLLAWLQEQRGRWPLKLIRLDPGQVARFSGARPVRGKTDKADARRIARFTATYAHELDGFDHDPRAQSMARLVRERDGLVAQATALKNQLRDRLVISWPELTQVFGDPAKPLARAVLRAIPTAAHAARKRADTLARIKPRGARACALGPKRAARLRQLAGDSIASATGADDAQAVFCLLDQLELIERRVAVIERRLMDYQAQGATAPAQPADGAKPSIPQQIGRLDAIRGIGPVGAASIVLRAGGLARFTGPKAFAAQNGACPDRVQTGKSSDKGRLTRRGDRRARSMLYLLTKTMLWFDPGLAFHKWLLMERGLKPKQAECGCMNRLARIMWAVAVGPTGYDPRRTIANARRHHADLWKTFVHQTRHNRKLWKNLEDCLQ
jgi:transposase